MPSTLKRTNSIRETPDPEEKPSKARKIREHVEEEDESMESEAEDDVEELEEEEEEEDEDVADSPFRVTQDSSNALNNDIDFDGMQINEAGTISMVEVVSFMCHKFLRVHLGPKINFVIGHNGSGKSAILTAITIALGANASATNRGKSLNSFIKEGESAANITIHLTNGGATPYKPDIFPNKIIVERKLIKDGGSSYKLKNASGRTVSTKKEDLVALLDHFGILVNNPLTMLTQDMARKFLSDSTSEDKYKLFMHGTQLDQLKKDYETVRESLDTAEQTLIRKRDGLPKLQQAANEAQLRYKEMNEAKEIDNQIDELSNELVWAQIIGKEKEAEKNKVEVEVAQRNLDQINLDYEAQKSKIENNTKQMEEKTNEWDVFKNIPDPDAEEKKALTEEKILKDVKIQDFKSDMEEINNRVKSAKAIKARNEQLLKQETEKLEASSKLKRNEITEQIEVAKAKMDEKVKKGENFLREYNDLAEEIRASKEKIQRAEQEQRDSRGKYEDAERQIRNLRDQQGDKMKAYGNNMPRVLDDIRRENRWKGGKPIGPIGATIKLLHMQYADTLETFFNKTLNAFVVETFEDNRLLSRILSHHKLGHIQIFIAERDIFDYSSGEPDEQFLTILRALQFTDEFVKRQLIISSKIEKTILMEDRSEADEVMYRKPHNVHLCFTSSGHKVGGKSGMKTESLEPYRGPPRFQTDLDDKIRKFQEIHREHRDNYKALEQKIEGIRKEIESLVLQQRTCKQNENKIRMEVNKIERYITDKEDALKEDDPVDLTLYEEEIKEQNEKLKNYVDQFQDINRQRTTVGLEAREIMKKLKAIEAKEHDREAQSNKFRHKLDKMGEERKKYQEELRELNNKRQTLKARLESRISTYNDNIQLVAKWTEDCKNDYPDRVETERSPAEVNIEMKRLQGISARLEQEMGASVEEVEAQAIATLTAWKEADKIINDMDKLSRSLKKMLEKRMEKWKTFREFMSLSARHYFSYYLHLRGDEGSLKFNHAMKKLEIRVSTGDQYSKGSRQKDSRSLSGGEKSFSQISLLLSLWQSISSPIICLDEFDVFMDAVNRKQTMSMIMNAASDNSSQYILITPQDASNMVPGKHVTIHRLADPDR